MYRLGLANINGELGLQRNVRDGNKWLKRSSVAATAEFPHALHELGLLHEKGHGGIIFKDPTYSLQLYAQAAELGYTPSAYRLGECFEYGYLGCHKDAASSIYYYTIAAKNGNPEACFALSAWYLSGEPKKIEPNEQKAFYWATLAAQKGLPKAEFALGYFAEMGIGRSKNHQEAVTYYEKAAKQGDEQARKRLTRINLPVTPSTVAIPSTLVAGEAR
jgi:TPR repeat protein